MSDVNGDDGVVRGFDGYAAVTDPRDGREDLVTETGVERHDAETYAAYATMEAFRSGWVATGVVLDAEDRVLLVHDGDDDLWVLPGGTLQSGESLREGLVREVREETGVDVDPVRARGVTEYRIEHATEDDQWTGFRVAFFEATAADTTTGDDLGVADESFTSADWFSMLPDSLFNEAFTRRVVAHTRDRVD
jgi:ADP-ribose pyrophosphatase YjhB (NUDIX family)